MAIRSNQDIPWVRRVTVDEWLTEDLIRFEVCELVTILASGEFLDEPAYWRDIDSRGGDLLACPDISPESSDRYNYLELLGLPHNREHLVPWKDLTEGQVFLSGEFEVRETGSGDNRPASYFICPEAEGFERIDDDVRGKIKTLYFELLANRGAE